MTSPRRVVFFDAYPHMLGGAQRMTQLLASGLRGRGYETEVDVPAAGRFCDALRAEGVAVRELDVPPALMHYGRSTRRWRAVRAAAALPGLWAGLARDLRGRAAVLHVDDHRGMVLIGPAARLARVPVVWHVHSVHGSRSLNLVCAVLARRVVVPSGAVLSRMPGLEALRPAVVIPNALPPSSREVRRRPPADRPTIVTVGRLHPDKGIDVLLRAADLLRDDHPDLRVLVIGPRQEGLERYEQEVMALWHDLGLEECVEFLGFVENPADVVAGATVYVQPARDVTEVQPIAVIEAMALALPLVATRAGGLPELVDDGRTGLLVPAGDPVALAGGIRRLLGDPDLAGRLGEAAAAEVRGAFGLERMLDAVVSVYESLG